MHSIELARGGVKVYAVEQSEAMVAHAGRKAAAAEVDLHVVHADMETFQLPVRKSMWCVTPRHAF